jgi:hypothetical protein
MCRTNSKYVPVADNKKETSGVPFSSTNLPRFCGGSIQRRTYS